MRSYTQVFYLLLSLISLSSLISAACESSIVIPIHPPSSYPSILPIICPPNPAGPHPPAPTSFCKCVCFTNSTIIALDPPASSPTSPASRNALFAARADGANSDSGLDEDGWDRKEYRAGNCNDCNRQFCLDYNLPICKGAKMEDVFTTCFQRDSRKDEAVVFIFIFATAGLLGWAAIKPWVAKWIESARERRSYIPLPNQADN